MSGTGPAGGIWAGTNFRVLVGTLELACAEVRGMASETASPPAVASTAVSGLGGLGGIATGAEPSSGLGTSAPTSGAEDPDPWIGASPTGHPPNARGPVLEWTLTPVTIRRAIDGSRALFTWRAAIVAGQADTRDVFIEVHDSPRGQPVLAWKLEQAWPLSWSGPVLDALQPGVAIEAVDLAYARLQWLKNPATGGV